MPAEILQQTGNGLFLVRLPDGREGEYPAETAQYLVQSSYDQGQPQQPQPAPQPQQPAFTGQEAFGPEFYEQAPQPAPAVPVPQEQAVPSPVAPSPAPANPGVQPQVPTAPTPTGLTETSVKVRMPLGKPGKGLTAPAAPDYAQGDATIQAGLAGQQQALVAQTAADIQHNKALEDQSFEEAQLAGDTAWQHDDITKKAELDNQQYRYDYQQALQAIPTMQPNRWWHDANGVQKISAVIGAALGGWLAAAQGGGSNQTLEMLNKMIEQDIQAQETDIATARDKVYRVKEAYEMNRQNTRDRMQRLEEQRGYRSAGLAAMFKKEAAKYASDISKAKLLNDASLLEIQAGQHANNAAKLRFDGQIEQFKAQSEENYRKGQLSQGWAEIGIKKRAQALEEEKARQPKPGEVPEVLYHPVTGKPLIDQNTGKPAVAKGTDEQVGKFWDSQTDLAKEYQDLQIVKKFNKLAGNVTALKNLGPEDDRRARAAYYRYQNRKIKRLTGASMTIQEADRIMGEAPLDTLFSGDNSKVLADEEDFIVREMETNFAGRGTKVNVRQDILPDLQIPEDAGKKVDGSNSGLVSELVNIGQTPPDYVSRDSVTKASDNLLHLSKRMSKSPEDFLNPAAVHDLKQAISGALKFADTLDATGNRQEAQQIRDRVTRVSDTYKTKVKAAEQGINKTTTKVFGKKAFPETPDDLMAPTPQLKMETFKE